MNEWEFYYEFKELCDYFKDKTYENKKITKMYYEKVKNMSIDKFKKMCERIIQENKYMPKIAEFGQDYIGYLSNMAHTKRTYSKEYIESFYDNI